jgi:hypothetical protein
MLLQNLKAWASGIDSRERVARFLNAYSVFISAHTGKEDVFFNLVVEKGSTVRRRTFPINETL